MIVKLIMSNTVRSSAKERQDSGLYRVEPWFAHMVCTMNWSFLELKNQVMFSTDYLSSY